MKNSFREHRQPAVCSRPAEAAREPVPRFPVFHVPHDGGEFPEELMRSVCIPEEQFLRYHGQMRDADIRLAVPDACRGGDMSCVFPVSRLLCDVERFIGPDEVMEQYGMGFCYEKAFDGTVIKHVTEELKQKTLRYYLRHHARMDAIVSRHPRVLLFDLHSYSDGIVPRAFLRDGSPAPDLCIGADARFTPPELIRIVRRRFAEAGFSAAVNEPYAGCFIPNAVLSGESACDLAAVMLEIHKRTYCTAEGRPIPEKLQAIAGTVRRIMTDCAAIG